MGFCHPAVVGCLGDGEKTATDEATDKRIYQKQLTKGLPSSQLGSRLMISQNLSEANMFSNYISGSFWKLLLSVCTF